MTRVLIVCVGNSVRSQMAEAYFNFYAHQHAMFFSAGLENTALSPYAVQVMAEDNIDLSEHLSKSLEAFNGLRFDYILTVCDPPDENYKSHLSAKVWYHIPIADPVTKGKNKEKILNNFRKTRDDIKVMVLKFIGQELLNNEKELIIKN